MEPAARRMKAFRIGPFQVYCPAGRGSSPSPTPWPSVFQLDNLVARADRLGRGPRRLPQGRPAVPRDAPQAGRIPRLRCCRFRL
ncbi:MAG: hypothetical protein M0C28_11375 [Candidatus Moduliflexus flocculans]|nr:hypothetical protein [Candidatus Moduliflexus flocculans]